MAKASIHPCFRPAALAFSAKRISFLSSRSLTLIALLGMAAFHPALARGQETTSPSPPAVDRSKEHRASRLIACPDCLREVSRRALSCPHCGCPGSAITEAVAAAEQAARPLPVLHARSDCGTGHALVIEENGTPYALLDARLLAGAESLTLVTLRDEKPVAYLRLEVAAEAGLVRLELAPQQTAFARLPLSPFSEAQVTSVLTENGNNTPAGPEPGATPLLATALASLDTEGRVVSLALSAAANEHAERTPVTPRQKWIPVPPADYRAQTALLQRLETAPEKSVLSSADRAALESTTWLTPHLQKSAATLLRSSPAQP